MDKMLGKVLIMQKQRTKINSGVALVMLLMIITGFFAFSQTRYFADKNVSKSKNIVAADKVTDKEKETETWTSIPQRAVSYTHLTLPTNSRV